MIESLLAALEDGDVDPRARSPPRGMVTAEAEPVPLRMLDSFLAAAPAGYAEAARAAAGTISLAGRLEHDEVARVMPAADALVFPSTFPEAFGMVAAEAAACGVLPIGADHSGMREVGRELAAVAPARAARPALVPDRRRRRRGDRRSAQQVARAPAARSGGGGDALPRRVRELWSWESVAQRRPGCVGGAPGGAAARAGHRIPRRMTRATLFRLVVAMLVLTAVISVGMLQIDWNGVAGSTEADDIDLLTDVMIVLSAFVYSIVLVMLGYSIWRYRAKPGDESDGEPIHGNTRLEIAWTVIPTVIVLFGAGYSWFILDEIEARDADRLQVDVTAQQFAWRFEYPEEGVTSTELHVPVDRQAEFNLKAIDVIHSFWVPSGG